MPYPPVPDSLNYIFCDHPPSFAHAVNFLRRCPFLILDCEGYDLGRAGGCVTLICVGTPLAEHIFIFDVISPFLTRRDIDGLLDLFTDANILKVVWDGRMDYLELWTTYGVALSHVLDLQVAEVVSRASVRGEGEPQRLKRLHNSVVHASMTSKYGLRLDGLHSVIGLQRCWKECGFPPGGGKDRESPPHLRSLSKSFRFLFAAEVMEMHKRLGSSMWKDRPLSEQLLQYAAKDILIIGVLLPNFYERGWIPRAQHACSQLLGQCQRYVSAHRDQGKSPQHDVFKPCAIMPLDVLNTPTGSTHQCASCNRWLSLFAYSTRSGVAPNGSGPYNNAPPVATLRSPLCRLCQLLALKAGHTVGDRYILTGSP